jgi:hypothetical protein
VIAEAIDTLFIVCHAILAWIVVGAAATTVVLFTTVLTGASVWRAIRRRHTPASQPQTLPCDSSDASTPQKATQRRTAPSWARQPHDYEDAA